MVGLGKCSKNARNSYGWPRKMQQKCKEFLWLAQENLAKKWGIPRVGLGKCSKNVRNSYGWPKEMQQKYKEFVWSAYENTAKM